MTNRDVWVLLEGEDGKITQQSSALLEEGARLSGELKGALHAIYLGPAIENIGRAAASLGAAKLYGCFTEKVRRYDPLFYEQVMLNLLEERQPYLLLTLSSSLGNDLLPRLSFKLKAPLVTNCAEIEVTSNGELLFVKPIHRGRLFNRVKPASAGVQMATFLPERLSGSSENRDESKTADVVAIDSPDQGNAAAITVKGFRKADHRTIDISEAEIIVAVGRGLGAPENFSAVTKLADRLGGAIGGTRPMVDAGVIPYERQIGQTGKRVSPKLIVLCGISGATEFVQGIAGAGTTVAINIDGQAPVLKSADLGIVGDINVLVPKILEHLNEINGPAKQA